MKIKHIVTTIVISIILTGCSSGDLRNKSFLSLHYDTSIPRKNCAIIIPGLNQTGNFPGYDSIGSYYKAKGMLPVYVNINWKNIGISHFKDAASQLSQVLEDSFPNSRYYLFGFSFGAVISLKLSEMQHCEHLLLCSMTPLFSEDRKYQIFPFKQILGMVTNHANELSYSLSSNTCMHFLYGDHDSFIINKAIIQNRMHFFKCNETIIVPGAKHDISGKSYLDAISWNIQRIQCDSSL